ncbi:protein translocase SEC61 complex subunit gamma [Caldiplasma sukawensis]
MTVEEDLIEVQKKVERKIGSLGKGKYARIIRLAKKPDQNEYVKVLAITGVGLIILGGIGFLIYIMMNPFHL